MCDLLQRVADVPPVRRRALDLLATGRTVRDVAPSQGIVQSCLHRWKSQDLVDRGLKIPRPAWRSSQLRSRLPQQRITEMENEVKILRTAGGGGPTG